MLTQLPFLDARLHVFGGRALAGNRGGRWNFYATGGYFFVEQPRSRETKSARLLFGNSHDGQVLVRSVAPSLFRRAAAKQLSSSTFCSPLRVVNAEVKKFAYHVDFGQRPKKKYDFTDASTSRPPWQP